MRIHGADRQMQRWDNEGSELVIILIPYHWLFYCFWSPKSTNFKVSPFQPSSSLVQLIYLWNWKRYRCNTLVPLRASVCMYASRRFGRALPLTQNAHTWTSRNVSRDIKACTSRVYTCWRNCLSVTLWYASCDIHAMSLNFEPDDDDDFGWLSSRDGPYRPAAAAKPPKKPKLKPQKAKQPKPPKQNQPQPPQHRPPRPATKVRHYVLRSYQRQYVLRSYQRQYVLHSYQRQYVLRSHQYVLRSHQYLFALPPPYSLHFSIRSYELRIHISMLR